MVAITTQRRLGRLEAGGLTPPCGYCGGGGGGDDDGGTYELYFEGDEPDDLDEDGEFCPECGTRLVYEIFFDDDPLAPWNRGEQA
jgi:hypothetical protein